jgi:hypothetical protein
MTPVEQIPESREPIFFSNWKAALHGATASEWSEYELYSDAHLTGEIRIGPYYLINTLANVGNRNSKVAAPVLVLRTLYCGEEPPPDMKRTDVSTYHGGWLADEVAALVSLALGVRMKAGPLVRRSDAQDALGRPVAYHGYEGPILAFGSHGGVIPNAYSTRSLDEFDWVGQWLETSPKNRVAMIRAARLYAEALWVAESSPELAWLFFVSAVEIAANCWDESKASALDRLKDSRPEVVEMIAQCCPELLEPISASLADSMGATRKFVSFLLNFLPQPPDSRPPEAFQLSWRPKEMKKYLRQIYDLRSRALHAGVPFPLPMCEPPGRPFEGTSARPEKPPGLATGTIGAAWLQKDTPMLLHMFEYLIRNTLKAWWISLRPEESVFLCGTGGIRR